MNYADLNLESECSLHAEFLEVTAKPDIKLVQTIMSFVKDHINAIVISLVSNEKRNLATGVFKNM